MKQLAEGAVVAGREGGLKEEGLVGGDGEAELRADDVDKLGDGVREGSGVRVLQRSVLLEESNITQLILSQSRSYVNIPSSGLETLRGSTGIYSYQLA